MRTFLGVFLILIVSAAEETIIAHLEDNVLLPCSCPDIDLNKELRWQMEEPKKLVLKYNPTDIALNKINHNVKMFLQENITNCSILLINVTVDDQGKYRCSYTTKTYHYHFVNLEVRARYRVCQHGPAKNPNDAQVFQCDAVGSYPEAEIQWKLDGQPLTESIDANITHDKWREATGFYHFNSTLMIKHNGMTQPTCNVKSEHVSNSVEEVCDGVSPDMQVLLQDVRHRYVNIIPIVLMLGVLLVLWQSFRSHGIARR